MLLSMTGFGEAKAQNDRLVVGAEIRSVNNRYLKINIRCPDQYATLEGDIERLIRKHVARGTLQLTLRFEQATPGNRFQIDSEVLSGYHDQLIQLAHRAGLHPPNDSTAYLALPGVVVEAKREVEPEDDWPLIESAVSGALEKLSTFRTAEGGYMETDLRTSADTIRQQLNIVAEQAGQVVADYRNRLLERVRELLAESQARVEPNDVIREVSVYADRCDINEEITRLRAHLEQFDVFLQQPESQGRKLEFLGQEMFREVNTIGSKANNVTIAHAVVEMKACIEKMREILQNVE